MEEHAGRRNDAAEPAGEKDSFRQRIPPFESFPK